MKKIVMLLTLVMILMNNSVFAQQTGKGASASANTASDNSFSWGIGLGALAILGVIVGVTVASATDSPSSFSH